MYTYTNKLIVGEKTPSYCYLKYAIDRIYDYNKNMKLILILREPISRAYSQYTMDSETISHKYYNLTFKDILNNKCEKNYNKDLYENGPNYIARGFYDKIIEYILYKFPKENLYIGIAEEIKNNKLYEYNKIIQFLGANKLNNININVDTNIGKYKNSIPKNMLTKLYNIYKSHNEKLYKILGRKILIWEKYYEQNI